MYGPSVQAMDTQLKAQLTLLSSLGAFCLFELRVFQTFLDNLRLICSGHGYPTQRAANTSCPRSDRFWLLELRVSRHFSTFYGPSVQAMDTQLGARQRRRTPTNHRGRAQRTISAGSWFGQGSSCPGDARRRHRVGVEVEAGLVMAAIRMPGLDRELQIMGRLRVFLTFVLAISRRMVSKCPPEPG